MSGRNAFAFLGRRRFLKLGLGAGGLVLGGGSIAWFSLFGFASDAGSLRVLSDREHRTLRNLATTILGPARVPVRERVADAFDGFLADEPQNIVEDLRNALVFIELGPVIYDRRWSSFTTLTQSEREAHFRSWMESDDLTRRMVATAFRKFINLVAHDDPALWPEIHYPGPATGLREG